eukprot:GHVS01100488.1.p1 GENE.GHVS01100488.1~~GHVS01100488.1.p1  ORF type:complete len:596 (-),score=107.61 GHVS01100488.1:309-1871(-)
MEALLERIVNGLLSVCATLGVVPVLRCPASSSSPAQMVALKLQDKLKGFLSDTSASGGGHLFGSHTASSAAQRPVLILLDRELDLSVMLHHTWTYQALVHDVLGLKLNRVLVPVDDSTQADSKIAPPKPKTYDIESSDSFWTQFAGSPFPEVAVAVSDSLNEYNKKVQEMGYKSNPQQTGIYNADDMGTSDLASAINALPEMTEKKRRIDMHTNIATALVNEIKSRSLDKYYEVEDEFNAMSDKAAAQKVSSLISSADMGTATDKARLLLCLFLAKATISSDSLKDLSNRLEAAGGGTAALHFLHQLMSFKHLQADLPSPSPTSFAASSPSPPSQPQSDPSTAAFSQLGGLGNRFMDKGRVLIVRGFKQLLPQHKNLTISRLVEALTTQTGTGGVGGGGSGVLGGSLVGGGVGAMASGVRSASMGISGGGGGKTDSLAKPAEYLYLDPKAAQLGGTGEVPRMRTPFKQAIVLVIGGGNYVEAAALQELATKQQKQIVYGATDFCSPTEFLDQLTQLGSVR